MPLRMYRAREGGRGAKQVRSDDADDMAAIFREEEEEKEEAAFLFAMPQ